MIKSTIIRVVAFAALFAYLLPFGFGWFGHGADFAFHGTPLAALGLSVAYMVACFALAGLYSLVIAPFKLTVQKRKSLWWLTGPMFFAATTGFLTLASQLSFFELTVNGWLAAIIGGAISMPVMALTMFSGGCSGGSCSSTKKCSS